MPTALRDLQPWRRTLIEHGLTLVWLAQQTGKSVNTVEAYGRGSRRPPAEWLARVEEVLRPYGEAVA